MEIDPTLITTKQVSELPPNPLSPTSLFPHQVGDILSQVSMEQLLLYVRSQSFSQPYETKFLTLPQGIANAYINENFDMSNGPNKGIGKSTGLWNGWAIQNGNNGTYNLDGRVLMGYGAIYNTIGQSLGSPDSVLLAHSHTMFGNEIVDQGLPISDNNSPAKEGFNGGGDGNQNYRIRASNSSPTVGKTSTVGVTETGLGKNIQPSVVCLIIYKLP